MDVCYIDYHPFLFLLVDTFLGSGSQVVPAILEDAQSVTQFIRVRYLYLFIIEQSPNPLHQDSAALCPDDHGKLSSWQFLQEDCIPIPYCALTSSVADLLDT